MKTQQELAAFAAILLVGCARMGTKPGSYVDTPLDTVEQHVPIEGLFVELEQKETSVHLVVSEACKRQKLHEVTRTHTDDVVNETPAVDYMFAVLGAGAVITGAIILADSGNVYENDTTSRQYNPIGEGAAIGIGAGTVAAGGLVLLIPAVDGVRASGTRKRETQEEVAGETVQEKTPCPKKPLAGANVLAAVGDDSRVNLGTTGDKGELTVDLTSTSIEETQALKSKRGVLIIGEARVGIIDLLPLAKARHEQADQDAWTTANPGACETLAHSEDCDGVRRYIEKFPEGAHAKQAHELLLAAEPKLPRLRDVELWAAAAADTCLGGESEDACNGVSRYVERFPEGIHIEEAKKTLKKGLRTIKNKAASKRENEAQARCTSACTAQCSSLTGDTQKRCMTACKRRDPNCGGAR